MSSKVRYLFISFSFLLLHLEAQGMQEAQNENVWLAVVNQHSQQFHEVNDRFNKVDERIANLTQQLSDLVNNYTNLVNFTNTLTPIGSIMEYSGTADVPNNWLECDGRALSRADYVELLRVIGITYGAGDLLNTFNIPDRRGRVGVGIDHNNSTGGCITNATTPNIALGQKFGEESHTLTVSEMPSHTHGFGHNPQAGSLGITSGGHNLVVDPVGLNTTPSGGNQPHNNMPPSIFLKYYIRAK